MFIPSSAGFMKTPYNLKRMRRGAYPTLAITPPQRGGVRLVRGLTREGGRGLNGHQTVFSKGSWAARCKYYRLVPDTGGLYSLHAVAGFFLRSRNQAHAALLRSSLGGYVLAAATQFLVLFSFCQVTPDSPLTAGVLWAQKSWWWRLALLAPHTCVSRVPVLGNNGFYAVSGGSSALFISGNLWGAWAFILLPSGQPKFVPASAYVSLGTAHPAVRMRRAIILAGDARRHGQKPCVRGTVKNPNDHPNGGRTRALNFFQTPWARPAKKPRKPRLTPKLKPLAKRAAKEPQLQELEAQVPIGLPRLTNLQPTTEFTPTQRSFSSSGYRSFRIVCLALCQRRSRLDLYLLVRFLAFLFSDRLCYMTVWFARGLRLSSWFAGELLRVHRGRKWKGVKVASLHKGQRVGVFARTRVLAVFQQAKTRKKRAKAAAAKAASAASQLRMDQAKRFKGKGGRSSQGLRVLNKAHLGSRWLRLALVEAVE